MEQLNIQRSQTDRFRFFFFFNFIQWRFIQLNRQCITHFRWRVRIVVRSGLHNEIHGIHICIQLSPNLLLSLLWKIEQLLWGLYSRNVFVVLWSIDKCVCNDRFLWLLNVSGMIVPFVPSNDNRYWYLSVRCIWIVGKVRVIVSYWHIQEEIHKTYRSEYSIGHTRSSGYFHESSKSNRKIMKKKNPFYLSNEERARDCIS